MPTHVILPPICIASTDSKTKRQKEKLHSRIEFRVKKEKLTVKREFVAAAAPTPDKEHTHERIRIRMCESETQHTRTREK